MLPEDEQEIVVTKYKGAEAASGTGSGMNLADQNQFLMMLLRAHCEAKQTRHVHDTAENRYIFYSAPNACLGWLTWIFFFLFYD